MASSAKALVVLGALNASLLLGQGMRLRYSKQAMEGYVMRKPSLSPRWLCLFNTATGANLRELSFLTSIVAVRFNKKSTVPVCPCIPNTVRTEVQCLRRWQEVHNSELIKGPWNREVIRESGANQAGERRHFE